MINAVTFISTAFTVQAYARKIIKLEACNTEFYTAEKCYIIELSNSDHDIDVSIARARVEPGITTNWHRLHDIIERYSIISGNGLAEIGDLPPQRVSAGDTVIIPAMCRQRITNTGTDDLIFLAICSPRFSNESYEDLQTTE